MQTKQREELIEQRTWDSVQRDRKRKKVDVTVEESNHAKAVPYSRDHTNWKHVVIDGLGDDADAYV